MQQSSIYQIIKSIQSAQGSIAKQIILDENAGNILFRNFMKATYDPAISYYQKKLTKDVASWGEDDNDFEQRDIDFVLSEIASRKVTGSNAIAALGGHTSALNNEGRKLMRLLIDRSIGASVGDTMVLRTWPDLYFIPPYQRCSLMDDKAKEKFGKLKQFYVQTKCDGSFAYIVKRLNGSVDVITRQGSTYPQAFAEKLAKDVPIGYVMVGELEVMEANEGIGLQLLDRKTGNGILNSCLKDGAGMDSNQYATFSVWDMLTEAEFVQGKSIRKYSERFGNLKNYIDNNRHAHIEIVYTEIVTSLIEAFAIYSQHLADGKEGCVAKDPDSLWKDGTAKDIVKMKLKFEAEYRCTGWYKGEAGSKYENMMGGINIKTEDGLLKCNCGTGFSDEQRADPEQFVDQVVMISANDIIQSRDTRKEPALSLPAFEEVRPDKKRIGANTLPEVLAIVKVAKEGK